MVFIKKLEVYGFKSFGFKNTTLNFDNGLVSITGPNGSGKSNVLDAIMFTLGENSPKALRVDRFQSLFHDTKNPSHRIIRVSLTFDNSDRGIPIDNNSITITREIEGYSGESQYHIDTKKVSKTSIMELLEIVIASPSKLNIVQQGMITKISELNPEERRIIIEDIIGLSYFDEKKAQSIRQLEESDRRLEIALARMGEIKKRIDELEIERNDQLRYNQLEKELRRYRAIDISTRINKLEKSLSTKIQNRQSCNEKISKLERDLILVKKDLDGLEKEKQDYMNRMNEINKTKAKIEGTLSSKVYSIERNKAILTESESRIRSISNRIPNLDKEKDVLKLKNNEIQKVIINHNSLSAQKKELLTNLRESLSQIVLEIEQLNDNVEAINKDKKYLEKRFKIISDILNKINVDIARNEENLRNIYQKIESDEKTKSELQKTLLSEQNTINEIEKEIELGNSTVKQLEKSINSSLQHRDAINYEVERSQNVFLKATKILTNYEATLEAAYKSSQEDISLTMIFKNIQNFRIIGTVMDLVKWKPEYSRPVVAAGSDWMKSIVVEDVEEMLKIAEFAKHNKLSKIKIIPLDIVNNIDWNINIDKRDVNVLGTLNNFVITELKGLGKFVLGNTVLTKSSLSAYHYAKKGFRSVSLDGELFEPLVNSMYLDFNSTITEINKIFTIEQPLNELNSSVDILHNAISKRNESLKSLSIQISEIENKKNQLLLQNQQLSNSLISMKKSLSDKVESINHLRQQNIENTKIYQLLKGKKERNLKRKIILENTLSKYSLKIHDLQHEKYQDELISIQNEKNKISNNINMITYELKQNENKLMELYKKIEENNNYAKTLDKEQIKLKEEIEAKKIQINDLRISLSSDEDEVKRMRSEEQQVINSSSNAFSILKKYDERLKSLRDKEKVLVKDKNLIDKEVVILKKEIEDLMRSKTILSNDLKWLGYSNLPETFEVRDIIQALSEELQEIKEKINLKADQNYVQIIESYRGMSDRKNQLEKEKYSIMNFIEGIVQEKKTVFMDAFDKVNKDIQDMFYEITGGKAYLELEDPIDIFSKGALLLVQFPNKSKRESTGLSGGEKTIAGIIFLLSLQALKPSPFYLMDEVDAHLDALNTERLINILSKRSKKSQIIMVTLKDTTLSKSDLVYGVFPKDGISQVVKYKPKGIISIPQEIT